METEQSNKAFDVLRWLGFLPVAVLAAWLAWIAVNILGRFSLSYVGIAPEDFQGKLYYITAGHAAMGAAFVYVGAKLAPAHRVIVAFVLGGIGIVVSGFLLFPAVMVKIYVAQFGGTFGPVNKSVHKN